MVNVIGEKNEVSLLFSLEFLNRMKFNVFSCSILTMNIGPITISLFIFSFLMSKIYFYIKEISPLSYMPQIFSPRHYLPFDSFIKFLPNRTFKFSHEFFLLGKSSLFLHDFFVLWYPSVGRKVFGLHYKIKFTHILIIFVIPMSKSWSKYNSFLSWEWENGLQIYLFIFSFFPQLLFSHPKHRSLNTEEYISLTDQEHQPPFPIWRHSVKQLTSDRTLT